MKILKEILSGHTLIYLAKSHSISVGHPFSRKKLSAQTAPPLLLFFLYSYFKLICCSSLFCEMLWKKPVRMHQLVLTLDSRYDAITYLLIRSSVEITMTEFRSDWIWKFGGNTLDFKQNPVKWVGMPTKCTHFPPFKRAWRMKLISVWFSTL